MSALAVGDLVRVGSVGLRTRRLRTGLSGLGIAIGIAAMVAVLGISASSRADLLAQLDELGTNLLTVSPGQTLFGENASLPKESVGMIGRIGPVESVSATGNVSAIIRRSDLISSQQSGGLAVRAARTDLLGVLGGSVRSGRFLDAATERYPAVVLGSVAAERLGIRTADPSVLVLVGDQWFTVVGILDSVPLAPEVDRSAMVGFPVAESLLGFSGNPTTIYTRSAEDQVEAVRDVLPATAKPRKPRRGQGQPSVGRPRSEGGDQEGPHRAAARAGCRRPARRRRRHRQRHGHLRPRTAVRDRPAPGPGRHPPADPRPVPVGVTAPVGPGRRGRRRPGRRGDLGLRLQS
jgi:putative ABC transport system permease protein